MPSAMRGPPMFRSNCSTAPVIFASGSTMTAAASTHGCCKQVRMDSGDFRGCASGRIAWEPGFASSAALRPAPRFTFRSLVALLTRIDRLAG